MSIVCTPLILFPKKPIQLLPYTSWEQLFSRSAAFPCCHEEKAKIVLAFEQQKASSQKRLFLLQCALVRFTPQGTPRSLNFSLVRITVPHPEHPSGAQSSPSKYSFEQHFWFPTEQEISSIAQTLQGLSKGTKKFRSLKLLPQKKEISRQAYLLVPPQAPARLKNT